MAALTGRILLVDSLGLRGHCSTGFLGSITMLANPKAEQVLSDMPCCLQSYNMGNKTNLLVAVRQPDGKDGPTKISLTTDHPTAMVLHWGVRRGTRSAALPCLRAAACAPCLCASSGAPHHKPASPWDC